MHFFRSGLFLPKSDLFCCQFGDQLAIQIRNGFKTVVIRNDNLCSSAIPFYKQTVRPFHKHI